MIPFPPLDPMSDGVRVPPYRAPWLHVLHDESVSEQEFVRKAYVGL